MTACSCCWLPDDFTWQSRWQYAKGEVALAVGKRTVAMLLRRTDERGSPQLECHQPIDAPRVRRNSSSSNFADVRGPARSRRPQCGGAHRRHCIAIVLCPDLASAHQIAKAAPLESDASAFTVCGFGYRDGRTLPPANHSPPLRNTCHAPFTPPVAVVPLARFSPQPTPLAPPPPSRGFAVAPPECTASNDPDLGYRMSTSTA